jgi:hypothetical protein
MDPATYVLTMGLAIAGCFALAALAMIVLEWRRPR